MYLNEVYLVKLVIRRRGDDVQDRNNVFVPTNPSKN